MAFFGIVAFRSAAGSYNPGEGAAAFGVIVAFRSAAGSYNEALRGLASFLIVAFRSAAGSYNFISGGAKQLKEEELNPTPFFF